MILRLIVQRLGLAVATLVVVSAIVFFFTSVLPGDIAERVLGRESSAEQRQIFRDKLNLDQPVWERYGVWLGDVVQGDFGRSLVNDQTVTSTIGESAKNTLFLSVFAFVLYFPVTLILATLAALFRGKLADSLISVVTLIGLSMPEFVLGTLLIFAFAVHLSVAPALSIVATLVREHPGTDEQEILRDMAAILREAAEGTVGTDDAERVEPVMALFGLLGEHQLVESNSVLASRNDPSVWSATPSTSNSS